MTQCGWPKRQNKRNDPNDSTVVIQWLKWWYIYGLGLKVVAQLGVWSSQKHLLALVSENA